MGKQLLDYLLRFLRLLLSSNRVHILVGFKQNKKRFESLCRIGRHRQYASNGRALRHPVFQPLVQRITTRQRYMVVDAMVPPLWSLDKFDADCFNGVYVSYRGIHVGENINFFEFLC